MIFYLKSHENRRLNLIPDQGTAEIKFTPNHPTKPKRTYTLSVTSRAAYLITLFNEKNVYTFAQLKKLLGDVPDKQLKVTLAGQVFSKMLKLFEELLNSLLKFPRAYSTETTNFEER